MFTGPRLSRVIRPIIFRWCCCYWFTHQRIVLETGKTTVTQYVSRRRTPKLLTAKHLHGVSESLVSRDGSQPSRSASARSFATLDAYSWDFSRFPRRRPLKSSYRQPLVGHFQVYQARQLRTDGVHCQEAVHPVKTSNINKRAKYFFLLSKRAKYRLQLLFCACCTRVGATGLELNLIK